jgi:3-amino-5-hydroxybenzoate synthase
VGGIIVTNDDELERLARSAHDCGRMPGEWFYAHYINGSNYRLSEWQGTILRQQLRRLPQQGQRRMANARYLDQALNQVEGITPQSLDPRCTHNGHYAYIFHYDAHAFARAPVDRFIQAINAEGIPNQASYPPLHELDVFTSGAYRQRLAPTMRDEAHAFMHESFHNTMRGAWETVWLPQYLLLGDEEDIAEIAQAIKKIQRHAHTLL